MSTYNGWSTLTLNHSDEGHAGFEWISFDGTLYSDQRHLPCVAEGSAALCGQHGYSICFNNLINTLNERKSGSHVVVFARVDRSGWPPKDCESSSLFPSAQGVAGGMPLRTIPKNQTYCPSLKDECNCNGGLRRN